MWCFSIAAAYASENQIQKIIIKFLLFFIRFTTCGFRYVQVFKEKAYVFHGCLVQSFVLLGFPYILIFWVSTDPSVSRPRRPWWSRALWMALHWFGTSRIRPWSSQLQSMPLSVNLNMILQNNMTHKIVENNGILVQTLLSIIQVGILFSWLVRCVAIITEVSPIWPLEKMGKRCVLPPWTSLWSCSVWVFGGTLGVKLGAQKVWKTFVAMVIRSRNLVVSIRFLVSMFFTIWDEPNNGMTAACFGRVFTRKQKLCSHPCKSSFCFVWMLIIPLAVTLMHLSNKHTENKDILSLDPSIYLSYGSQSLAEVSV